MRAHKRKSTNKSMRRTSLSTPIKKNREAGVVKAVVEWS
jgi:hypothetical protein